MALVCSERIQREAAISVSSLYNVDTARIDLSGNFVLTNILLNYFYFLTK